MTATMTPQATPEAPQEKRGLSFGRGSSSAVKIALSGEPSVQLLPASIRDRAAGRSRMRAGVLLVILGLLVAVAIVAAGTLRAGSAQLALVAANNRTSELISQQAQYVDAVRVAQLVAQIEELELGATVNEVAWSDLFGDLVARVPAGGQLMAVKAVSQIPWEPAAGAPAATTPAPTDTATTDADGTATEGTTDPGTSTAPTVSTQGDSTVIATIDITLASTTIPDGTAFLRSLSALDGYQFAVIREVAVGTDGVVTTTITLQLNIDGASGRFVTPNADDSSETDSSGTDDSSDSSTDGTEG